MHFFFFFFYVRVCYINLQRCILLSFFSEDEQIPPIPTKEQSKINWDDEDVDDDDVKESWEDEDEHTTV